ncbi:MAG TPA: fused MFS/spermidine synthase [Vicinamibacteria bacterium]
MTPLFTATVLLGSSLLFLVQPMVGKRLLPQLGAAPAVWSTCLVFFQAVLLAGYAYAHGAASWLSPRRRLALHAVLVLVPLAALPFPDVFPAPSTQARPTAWLLQALAVSVGVPFLVLSASAPVLQGWYSGTIPSRAGAPWFLLAASNAGSLLGLVAYPTLVEPRLSLPAQAALWSRAYGVYAALVLVCARQAWQALPGSAEPTRPPAPPGGALPRPRPADVARWVVLSAVPSSLTLGVTTHLATDVASLPLLWVLPLSLYLLTFVVAFSRISAAATRAADRVLPMQVLLVAMLTVGRLGLPLGLALLLHLLLVTAAALVCHGLLAQSRPRVEHLTGFYLAIGFGGALGGAFNALVAPAVFDSVVEYPLAIVLACALRPVPAPAGEGRPSPASTAPVFLAGALTLAIVLWGNHVDIGPRRRAVLLAVPVLVAYAVARRPRRFAAAVALILLAGSLARGPHGPVVRAERTFFGVLRVHEDSSSGRRVLMHGTTLHGAQSLDPSLREEPLAYYHRSGPAGQAFEALPAASRARVAVVGLGAGALASYARPGQTWTFFEIDPAVERIARDTRLFSYLAACGERCTVVTGDARLSLARLPEGAFDLVVLDAFSSDAIPFHLVTREAFALYGSRLAGGGAILVHHSNRHLALEPVLGRIAHALGLVALSRSDPAGPEAAAGKLPSEWMVMARDARDIGPLIVDSRWVPVGPSRGAPLWTDDYSSLAGVIRFRSLGRDR